MVGRPVKKNCPVDRLRLVGGEQHCFVRVNGAVERLGSGGVDEGHSLLRGVGRCVLNDAR